MTIRPARRARTAERSRTRRNLRRLPGSRGASIAKPLLALGLALAAIPGAGCTNPMDRSAEQRLRESVRASHLAYLNAVAASPNIEIRREFSRVEGELTPERRAELEDIGGPIAHRTQVLELGPDLRGRDTTDTVSMTLQRAVQLAVEHNLEIAQARLLPGIAQAQITQAEAAFDAVAFVNIDLQDLDTPKPPSPTSAALFGTQQAETYSLTTGIRKLTSGGGQITMQTQFSRIEENPSFFSDDGGQFSYYTANVLLGVSQPLLRNFGTDVTRSQVSLARSARRQSVQDLRRTLLETILNTEEAYWELYFSQQQVLIQRALLNRTEKDLGVLEERLRLNFDVSPVEVTEARSVVESVRADLIRARQELRRSSDRLKRLINAPDLPLSGETQIIALDAPADLPVTFNLLDAVSTALRKRPELQRAVFEIDDASVRQMIADNQRLPELNLSAAIRYNGQDQNVEGAYRDLITGGFIDYLIGVEFEVPIGNRGPEALFEQRKLERRAAVLAYRRAAQDVLLQVKDSLRRLFTAYELIGATRAARMAAADNLRAFMEQERVGAALTPDFVNRRLQAQQRLAIAELEEARAMADYNTAIARLYQSMGTLLERNNIDFRDPPTRDRSETGFLWMD
jgi:outer membrane protein